MDITRIKGFADILPGEVESWQRIERKAREVFARYNFAEIRIPIMEKTELFSRSIGETTDIVEKEMYTFADQEGKGALLTLRPEGTAGVVRAYVENDLYKMEPVQRLFYFGPMFRREKPQKGRLRQFYQIGAELLGRSDAMADAEILLLLNDFFSSVGLESATLELNSVGCALCRPRYRGTLLAFLEERKSKLCENCRRRMERNPLRVLDCKEKSCIEITAKAPSILDFLCNECRAHFAELRRYLEAVGLRYQLNPRMVRGLDYYCRTAFEWTSTQLGAQNAVAAGGRYDGLVKELGGPATPGVGFALGMERLVSLLRAKVAHRSPGPVLYVAWIGQAARDWAFPAVHALRQRGLTVELDGEQRSLKSQMKRADKLRARYVIILGDDELQKGKGTLRNMDSKEQTEVNLERIAEDLPKRLGATNVEAGETYDEARVAAGTDHQGR